MNLNSLDIHAFLGTSLVNRLSKETRPGEDTWSATIWRILGERDKERQENAKLRAEINEVKELLDDERRQRAGLRKMIEEQVLEHNRRQLERDRARLERDEARKERDAARQALELYQSGKVSGNACIPPYVSWAKIADHVAKSGAIPRPRFAGPKTADMLHEENKQQMETTETVLVLAGSFDEFRQFVFEKLCGNPIFNQATRSAQYWRICGDSTVLVRVYCIIHPDGLIGLTGDRLAVCGTWGKNFSFADYERINSRVRQRVPTPADAMRAAHVREMEQRQQQHREGAD